MCGICGYISRNAVTARQLEAMTNSLEHRGPDDSGVWRFEDRENGYHVGLGHRRLSIFDLSSLGHQPMESSDGSVAVSYNGEIYNFLALRAELEAAGYSFRSSCDTEVLLCAYRQWGDECFSRFNGMFAIALYDRAKHRAVFARDRMGKKPLYYSYKGNTLIFGSELKALMAHPEFVRDIDREHIAAYLSQMCYHSPVTVFRDTFQLEPGNLLIWENGSIAKRKYWDLTIKYQEGRAALITDELEAKDGLKTKIRDSVKARLAADVPVGVFLSGGIDSTVVASTAARLSDKPVKTFTIGFFDAKYNEAERAKKIAAHLATDHTELYISEEEALRLTADIPHYYDEPFADFSQIPTMLVSRLAREDVTVALSGDGGDELFCGYNWYNKKSPLRVAVGIANIVKDTLRVPGISKLKLTGSGADIMRGCFGPRHRRANEHLRELINHEISGRMMAGGVLSRSFDIADKGSGGEIHCISDRQERNMVVDMLTYLPDDILCKVDRASMRYALEMRCPLLDVDVVEYSFTVPLSMKYRKGEKKWLLKQVAYDYVPPELLDMPKSGFSVPIEKWIRGPLRNMVEKYLNGEIIEKQGIFNKDATAWLVASMDYRHGPYCHTLWSLLMFQMWYQLYIEDLW